MSTASIDTEQRAAETRLYEHYGLAHTERFVRVDGVDVRVVDVPGDPAMTPVLLLHGAASVTAAAIPLIPAFGGAPVIAIDWPGHGLSGAYPFARDTNMRTFAVSIISAVTESLDEFDIVAHSLGGQFALYFCLAAPDRVRRLVLLGAPGAAIGSLEVSGGFGPLAIPVIGDLLVRIPVSRIQYGKNSAVTLGAGTVDGWPRELVDVGWYASRRPTFHSTLPRLFRAIVGGRALRAGIAVTVPEAASLPMPTLFVWGDADVFLPPSGAAEWIAAMPSARLVELSAGHAPWLNKPREAASAVREFWRSR